MRFGSLPTITSRTPDAGDDGGRVRGELGPRLLGERRGRRAGLVDDHEQADAGGVRSRGEPAERRRLLTVRRSLAGLPDAGDRERVEAGPGQLAEERRGRARAGGVVDDADGERVPRSGPAPGEQDQRCEESASTNGAVLTAIGLLKQG